MHAYITFVRRSAFDSFLMFIRWENIKLIRVVDIKLLALAQLSQN